MGLPKDSLQTGTKNEAQCGGGDGGLGVSHEAHGESKSRSGQRESRPVTERTCGMGPAQIVAGIPYPGAWASPKSRCHVVTSCSMGVKEKVPKGRANSKRRHAGAGTPWGIPAGREGERVRCFLVEGPGSCRSVLGCPKDSLCPPLPLPLVKSLCHKTVNTTSSVTLWTLSLEVH